MVEILTIHGGRPLYGSVAISGAKNAVLPLLAATAAHGGEYCLHNCPHLTDVTATVDILEHLGCTVRREGDAITVDSTRLSCTQIPRALMLRLRSSVIFLGALLARCGTAQLWLPGGCCIGARPIDIHLEALRQLGAEVEQTGEAVYCRAQQLRGGKILLPYPSVGATENLLLASLGCQEETVISNAAREPEVVALSELLCAMGAHIDGAGTATIRMVPGKLRAGASVSVPPDRMEAATYLCALGACGGELFLKHADPCQLSPVLDTLRSAGMTVSAQPDGIAAHASQLHQAAPVCTGPYPAFPTDAQAPMMAALLRARGTTYIEETVFEHRFRHVDALRAMGAEIALSGNRATIHGVEALHGADVAATDLRGGAAMVIAALGAEGVSHISQTQHIFRGYDGLCQKLAGLGADIALHTAPSEDTA